jgi:hypothetical protein
VCRHGFADVPHSFAWLRGGGQAGRRSHFGIDSNRSQTLAGVMFDVINKVARRWRFLTVF